MGKIKTKLIKRISGNILKQHKEKLKDNFEDNKAIVSKLADIPSKKMRNVIAGYTARQIKESKEA